MFGKMKAGLNKVGKGIEKGVNDASKKVNEEMAKLRAIKDMFKTGNVIQLVSRSSGKTLQVVDTWGPMGKATVDGKGMDSPDADKSKWTCINLGSDVARLHNGDHFLAIKDGSTCIVSYDDHSKAGKETEFNISQVESQFAMLESVVEKGRHVGCLANGDMKPALATGKENDAHFAVRLLFTPEAEKKEEEKSSEASK